MKEILVATLLWFALGSATSAFADWQLKPNAAWAGDAGVTATYEARRDTPTGPRIGTATVLPGPVQAVNVITDDPFEGFGSVVCVVAWANRGTVKSVEVSSCPPAFPLGAPVLSFTP